MRLEGSSSRIFNLDLIRVVAMTFVILLHTILNFTLRPDFLATPIWFLFEPLVAFAKTGVLLFFFVSGYLVIGKQRSAQENLQKLTTRIVVPLVVFEGLLLLYRHFVFPTVGFQDFLWRELDRFVNFPSSPLWFLEVLVILYLLNPLWQSIFLPQQRIVARYVVSLAGIFAVSSTFLEYFLGLPSIYNIFTGWIGFVVFYLYGALVQKGWVTPRPLKWYFALLAGSIFWGVLSDYFASSARVSGIEISIFSYTMDYLSLPVLGTAFALFHIFLEFDFVKYLNTVWGRRVQGIVTWFSSLTFGIYLTHIFVIGVLTDVLGFRFDVLGINVYVYNVIYVTLVVGISLLLTLFIRNIPILRASIGETQ